jgi:hypothetical protein
MIPYSLRLILIWSIRLHQYLHLSVFLIEILHLFLTSTLRCTRKYHSCLILLDLSTLIIFDIKYRFERFSTCCFISLLLLLPPYIQIFFSVSCFQTPSTYVLPPTWRFKFSSHTNQQNRFMYIIFRVLWDLNFLQRQLWSVLPSRI